ncbi:MAG: fumarylacetoacetase [Phycisphaerales bacterium]|nr:fumarylacetoacetase [Planctomycetota bacterium]MCH8509781.1 fumarylacetoacetase [Phycisphaerales bacterium]
MPYPVDETHDPKLESWIESANDPNSDFPIQNLPFVMFDDDTSSHPYVGVAIGDKVLNLHILDEQDFFGRENWEKIDFISSDLNGVAASDSTTRREIRSRLQGVLKAGGDDALRSARWANSALRNLADVRLCDPVLVRDYTDFYASIYHATNVGSMFRPDNPLLPNYKHIPIGYHGRASSIVPSGTPVRRPVGQQAPAEEGGTPGFGPCKMLDYEMEMGAIIARGNELGEPISMADAEDRILGVCILNDWSARDIQKWEYQPLGPFLAKSFASTVSPYIVTMEALAPFRCPAFERDAKDPRPLPYMDSEHNRAHGGIEITLEVYLASQQMRDKGMAPVRLSRGNFRDMYWTFAQMVAHHTVNGCNLQPGDLLGSGTVSGTTRESRGSLLELTWDGDPFANPPVLVPGTQRTPIKLPTGEERKFLQDGDEVIMKAYCEREGFRRIGFGECRGIITPARVVQ